MLPKLVITDIDGVWTDGGMYYDENGKEWKKFNTSDSAGVLFLRLLDIPVAIITGENTGIVTARAKKLNIEHCFMGVRNKVEVAGKLIEELGIDWREVAYIGDDINDIPLLKKVGISACPSQAPGYVKESAGIQMELKGGEGVFREFTERLLKENHMLEIVLEKYFDSIKS